MTQDLTIEDDRQERTPGEPQPQTLVVFVLNEQGLHARPAARLAQEAQKYEADIKIVCNGNYVDAKSILDVLTLAAGNGTSLELTAVGPDASEALESLGRLFKNRFAS
jgi:phosphocarrier protein HPr